MPPHRMPGLRQDRRRGDAMGREADDKMAAARVGRPANYRADARFVLKLLPDMDRDKAKVDQRIEASLEEGRKRGRLTRHEMPPGTAGYLYAQARAFLAGVGHLSDEKAALALADFEYGEPHLVGVDGSAGEGTLHVTGRVPVVYRRPSGRELMERMGTALVTAMAGAFACELGKKAILVTRLDGAAKTHDLLALYRELPDDSRRRLEGDFLSARLISPNREEKNPVPLMASLFSRADRGSPPHGPLRACHRPRTPRTAPPPLAASMRSPGSGAPCDGTQSAEPCPVRAVPQAPPSS